MRFLPAYSPDVNPIEFAVATIKHRLRATAAHATATIHRATADTRDAMIRAGAHAVSAHSSFPLRANYYEGRSKPERTLALVRP